MSERPEFPCLFCGALDEDGEGHSPNCDRPQPVPHCGECKFWDRMSLYSEGHPAHAIEPAIDWGFCELGSAPFGVVDHPETKACAARGSMVTYHDFSCTQWERRE